MIQVTQRMNSAISRTWPMQSFHATVNEIPDFTASSHRNKSFTCTISATKPENDSPPTKNNEDKPNGSAGNRKQGRPGVKSRGSSRRTRLHKASLQEQVKFTTVVRDDPHVAVIGGGMSGLICALTLEQRGIRSTVFDTIADYCASGGSNPDEFGMGLHKEFTPIGGHDIGQFPGSELLEKQDSVSSEPAFV